MAKKQSKDTVSKRQALREQRQRKQRQQRMVLIFSITFIALVVAGLLIIPSIINARTPVGEVVVSTPNPRPQADFNTMGDPNAPVKMQEFSDFQCPFCKHFYDDTEHQIVENYVKTGKVYFTYTPYGPAGGGQWIGPESEAAAEAAFCAGDQGKFWEYHDIVFANQTGENVGDYTDKRLMAFAETLKLDMNQFRSCYNSHKYSSKIQQGLVQGAQAGMGGTPSFLINGKKVEGALPFSDPSQPQDFKREIEAALAAANQ